MMFVLGILLVNVGGIGGTATWKLGIQPYVTGKRKSGDARC
jgi:hypothetical protein